MIRSFSNDIENSLMTQHYFFLVLDKKALETYLLYAKRKFQVSPYASLSLILCRFSSRHFHSFLSTTASLRHIHQSFSFLFFFITHQIKLTDVCLFFTFPSTKQTSVSQNRVFFLKNIETSLFCEIKINLMATALSDNTQSTENLETYCIIWVDSYVNSSSENRQAQEQLKSIIHHMLTFENDHQCLQYLKNLSRHDRAILIASGRSGRNLVPQITQLGSLSSIYIYCMDKQANEQWSRPFTKVCKRKSLLGNVVSFSLLSAFAQVKGVVTRISDLIETIFQDYLRQQNIKLDETLSMKIYNDQSTSDPFVQSQLLIDCLLRLKSSSNEKKELVSFCKDYYQHNPYQLKIIKEFDQTYSSDRVIWWFTRYGFLSRILTKAFREENWDLLLRFRFFLHDLGCQLGKNRCATSMRVYRSQLMSKDEVQLLKNSVGKYLSINTFLSTYVNAEQSRLIFSSVNCSPDSEKVLFEIEADSRLSNSRPFADIQSLGYSSQVKQILFMVGSIFRVSKVKCDEQQIWNIRLHFCSSKDRELKVFFQQMKSELGTGRTNLFQFAQLLQRTGKIDQSEKYFRRYLNQLPNDHRDIGDCYQSLATIAQSRKNFPSTIKWYKRSLEFARQTHGVDNSNLAEIYSRLGNVYMKINDCKHAIKFYEKALEIYQKTSSDNPSRTILALNNLGAVYDMKKDYAEALRYYQKALDMAKKTKDPELARTLRNIGNVYELQGQFQQALDHYQKALKIYQSSSTSNSVYIQDIDASIQRISSKKK